MPILRSPVQLVFDQARATVRAEAGDNAAAAAAGGGDRRIEGVLVPYGVEGRAADGVLYVFEAGSLTAPRGTVPFLLGHDRNRPIGVVASHADSDAALHATFAVDATPDGDVALAQAQSGSRAGLSVGAQPVLYQLDESGDELVVRIQQADWLDASLVTLGAYESALVTHVAAQAPTGGTPMPPDTLAPAAPARDAGQAASGAAGEPPSPAATLELAAGHPRIVAGAAPRVALCAGELVALIVRAQHGEPDARRHLVEAALVESISTDVSGLLPPSYETTVIGGKDNARPLYDAFKGKPLPGVGLLVSKPKWITRPDGAWAANVDADATSTKVTIGSQTADVARWDWAGAFPWVVVQRSSPDLIDEVYAEAVQDWYLDVEAKIYGELSTASPGVATTLGAAIAEFFTATGNQKAPEVIVMAPDVWGAFADVGQLSVALGQGGTTITNNALATSFAGIPAITAPTLPPGEVIMATKRAVDVRVTEPVRLTANAIGALNVELAVVGEGLFDTDYPAELLKFAAITPAAAGFSSSRSSK